MNALRLVVMLAALGARVCAQSDGTLVLYGNAVGSGGDHVLRIDRDLTVLSAAPAPPTASLESVCAMATNAAGERWVAAAPLGPTQLIRLNNRGGLLPPVTLAHNPVQVAAAASGRVYVLTRIPLLAPGPMYCVDPTGSVAWTSWEGPSLYTVVYPRQLCVTSDGELWMGDVTPPHGQFWAKALLLRIHPDDGSVIQALHLPDLSGPSGDEGIGQLVGDTDGGLWAHHAGADDGHSRLVRSDGRAILDVIVIEGGFNGATWDTRLDGLGRLHVVSLNSVDQAKGSLIYRYDPETPERIESTFSLGGVIQGFALGATGEDLFAIIAPQSALTTRRLERLNLRTGVKSSVSLAANWLDLALPNGDPTGFIYANVVDRQGDNDGDGAPNGAETAAGSNPFDSSSRPNGPKVCISFAQSNGAIILKYVDPDGILDPTGGLDLASLSLVSSQHGEIFSFLLPFLTFVQVSADQTEVTALFGALPIAPDLKWQFEATVRDKTGATGWDWQVSRPGNL